MAVGGIRLQLFTALAIAVLGAALAAAVIAYHVFDRELERTVEARLQMLVAEAGRVLDAGIAAGLDIDRPQLQDRALQNLRPNLGVQETILVADAEGRIIAGSDAATIGESLPPDQLAAARAMAEPAAAATATGGGSGNIAGAAGPAEVVAPLAASLADEERIAVVRPVQSLFGGPAGYVAARLGTAALDQPRRGFVAKLSLLTAGFAAAGILAAALIAFWGPWRARRVVGAVEGSMHQLYAGIGTPDAPPPATAELPAGMRAAMDDFATAVQARQRELAGRAETVDLLDEAA